MEMTRGELEANFKNLASSIADIKKIIEKIENHQQQQYKKVIILEEHQKIIKKDIEDHKKDVRWGIGIIMPTITAGILFVANFFIKK